MLKRAITAGGLALLRAGVAQVVSAGLTHLVAAKLAGLSPHRLYTDARAVVREAEHSAESALGELRRDARDLRRLVRRAARGRAVRGRSPTLSLAAAGLGLSAGAGLMFLLDPVRGGERRAALRSRLAHAAAGLQSALAHASEGGGVLGWARRLLHPGRLSDEQLLARVRTVLGCITPHAGDVTLQARHGAITVGGAVPFEEIDKILTCIAATRGVQKVHSQLDTAPTANGNHAQRETSRN
ncbi:MAG: hypothetical protein U1A78_19805 [Polyangia bacterium]